MGTLAGNEGEEIGEQMKLDEGQTMIFEARLG